MLPRLSGRPSRQVVAAALAIATAMLLTEAFEQGERHEQAVAHAETAGRNAALLLAEHAAQAFDGVEETLRAVGRLRDDVARGVYRSQASIYVNLKTLQGGSAILDEVGWFDRYGERVATSRELDPPRVGIALEERFFVPSGGEPDRVHVSTPIRASAEGGWEIPVSLRLENLDGSFAGVAVGTVDPQEFARIFQSLDLGPGYSITLLRSDGTVLVHEPDTGSLIGRSLAESALFRRSLLRAPSGTYHGPGLLDGPPQIASYATGSGAGDQLVAHVAVSSEVALAEFWSDLWLDSTAIVAPELLVIVIATRLLVVVLRRREHLQRELAEATKIANAARIEAEAASEAKSEFLANVSHELRTPLTLILAPLGQLLGRAAPPPDWRTQLERMQHNALLLLNRVNDTLDFAKAEAGSLDLRWELVDLTTLVPALVDDATAAADAGGTSLTCRVDGSLDGVHLDRKHFETILLNLVSNALKFTPSGGTISLEVRALDGDRFELAVADSGVGIPADKLSLLFQRFQQVDGSHTRRHGGTGIGLALVKQFTEQMGGTVGVESEPGRGTRFSVRLPRRQAPGTVHAAEQPDALPHRDEADMRQARFREAASLPASPGAHRPAAGGRGPAAARALVVDDNPDLRDYLADLLSDELEVLTAADGLEAWAMLQDRPVDVVVSDVMMPGLDGLGLVARIRASAALSHIPVLLVTARGGQEASVSALEAGADDYIAKPFTPDELRARVSSALRMSRTQAELRQRSREAGMSTVAIGILHDLGNLLNSVTVSSSMIDDRLRSSHVRKLGKVVALLEAHESGLAAFLERDTKGRALPAYLKRLSEELLAEREVLQAEVAALRDRMDHAVGVLATQKSFTKRVTVEELISLEDLMETALRLSRSSLDVHGVEVARDYAGSSTVVVDGYKVLQILLNLIENACQAVRELPPAGRRLLVRSGADDGRVWLRVEDNGAGVAPEHLQLIFNQGFTTKETGHGLGLHSSANLAREMGGSLRCRSNGAGKGACFILALPATSTCEEHSWAPPPASAAG